MIQLFLGGAAGATPSGAGTIQAAGSLAAEGDNMVVAGWIAGYYNDDSDE
jgi:hypothetical protein